LGWQAPLKNVPFLLNESALRELLPLKNFNEKSIRAALSYLGKNREFLKRYMHKFVQEGTYNLIDATEFFSKSSQISLAQKGYNKDMVFDDQISILYLYSASDMMPTFYRLLAGNLREVKTMSLTIKESKVKNAVIIGDKGFYSKSNIEALKEDKLDFIIPLKRDNSNIDYHLLTDIESSKNYFKYKDRYIYYTIMQIENDTCVLFFDGKLKEQEKTDYLNRIQTLPEQYNHDKFLQRLSRFGTIALLTNLKNEKPESLYATYKSRANIEQMFDSLKNVLDADKSYMQNEEMLEGWMFINHIALQCYHILYNRLKKKDLLKTYSVDDILLYLKHIRQIRINDEWTTTEITTKITKALTKLEIHIT
jgi:transposase